MGRARSSSCPTEHCVVRQGSAGRSEKVTRRRTHVVGDHVDSLHVKVPLCRREMLLEIAPRSARVFRACVVRKALTVVPVLDGLALLDRVRVECRIVLDLVVFALEGLVEEWRHFVGSWWRRCWLHGSFGTRG